MDETYLADAMLENIEAYKEHILSGNIKLDKDTYGADQSYNWDLPIPYGFTKENIKAKNKAFKQYKKMEIVVKNGEEILDKVHTEVMESISKKSKEYLDANSLQNYEMLQNVKIGVQVLYQRLKSEYEK